MAVAFQGILEHHDRQSFELFGYSLTTGEGGPTGADNLTHFFRAQFDRYRELSDLPFDQAARLINDDGGDILIDLAGHTRGARLELFALEPAPVQAHYLGFQTPIGADFIPYLITDRRQAPPEIEPYYSEKLVFLPDTFMATTRPLIAETAVSRRDCGLPDEGFVFANFNSHYKFDPWIFSHWMRLLRTVPGSVIWFLQGTPTSRENLKKEAARRGIDPDRLVFAPKYAHPDHLARHKHIDLCLDNQTHGGGVTTVDALWFGVPVVTVAGDSPASRNGASILSAIGLPDLITETLDEYQSLAFDLARDPGRLGEVRTRLAANRQSAPLFDTPRLTRHLEAAYRLMWQNREAGYPPRSIEVPEIPG